MCLANLAEIADAVRAAEKAAMDLREFDAQTAVLSSDSPVLTNAEIRGVLRDRVRATEAVLRGLGFNPPPTRVVEGDAERELVARGVTLPGNLPKSTVEDQL